MPTNWDDTGCLSIVVQGSLHQGNLVETARHCQHWRTLLPQAQLILAISVTDMLVGTIDSGVYVAIDLAPKYATDGHLCAALDILRASCDLIAQADSALPLPPIKSDSPSLNNFNFQLAAAQRGLSLATGRFVLRIRSDMIFANRAFIDQYEKGSLQPRAGAAVFTGRVMISWLFTLNPFGPERLPLHFSDWFHFGPIEDVRRIWTVPPMTLADGLYYRTHPHVASSNTAERLFNIRLGVEQHLMLHCFSSVFPDLVLRHHNDRTSTKLSLDILLDNFVVCDLARAHCVFDKYSDNFTSRPMRWHCITADAWHAMTQARDTDYHTTLLHEADRYSPTSEAE